MEDMYFNANDFQFFLVYIVFRIWASLKLIVVKVGTWTWPQLSKLAMSLRVYHWVNFNISLQLQLFEKSELQIATEFLQINKTVTEFYFTSLVIS